MNTKLHWFWLRRRLCWLLGHEWFEWNPSQRQCIVCFAWQRKEWVPATPIGGGKPDPSVLTERWIDVHRPSLEDSREKRRFYES